MSGRQKIVSETELLAGIALARQTGKTVVHCHGCFDIVHPGHIRYLEFARRQGDVLVVSLTGDAEIDKGDQRPYIPQELRAENLAALAAVDFVYINPHPTAEALLASLRPDIYVKGSEYEQSNDPGFARERAVVSGYGGRVVFSSGEVVFSSTRLLETLGKDAGLETERLAAVCSRHDIDRDSLAALLQSFTKLNVLVIGDVILDRYVLCDATDLASEAPMMSLTRLEERRYVGGAGIVARHLAALGASSHLLSTAADDAGSRWAREVFEQESVATRLLPCRPNLPEKTRYLVDTTKVMRVEDARACPLDSEAEEQAAEWVRSLAPSLDAVIFCDFGYGTITTGLLTRLRKLLSGVRVVTADVSGQRSRLLQFRNVSLLCPTERELRSALHDFDRGLSTVAWRALEATQARQMMVTLGKKGLVMFERPADSPDHPQWRGRLRSEYLPSLADAVVDPLGCGDAMLAAASLALAAGGNLMQAAYLGSAAASIEIARLGNMPVEAAALARWISGRLELTARCGNRPSPHEPLLK